jgi:hypothetical protein
VGVWPTEEALCCLRPRVDARFDADAPVQQGGGDRGGAILVPVHGSVIREHCPGTDLRSALCGVWCCPGPRGDADGNARGGSPHGCEGRGNGGGIERVLTVAVLGVEVDVLGAGGNGRAGCRRQLLRGHGQVSAFGGDSGTVQANLQHDVIFSGGSDMQALPRE